MPIERSKPDLFEAYVQNVLDARFLADADGRIRTGQVDRQAFDDEIARRDECVSDQVVSVLVKQVWDH
jgi:hypothetical protein